MILPYFQCKLFSGFEGFLCINNFCFRKHCDLELSLSSWSLLLQVDVREAYSELLYGVKETLCNLINSQNFCFSCTKGCFTIQLHFLSASMRFCWESLLWKFNKKVETVYLEEHWGLLHIERDENYKSKFWKCKKYF